MWRFSSVMREFWNPKRRLVPTGRSYSGSSGERSDSMKKGRYAPSIRGEQVKLVRRFSGVIEALGLLKAWNACGTPTVSFSQYRTNSQSQ